MSEKKIFNAGTYAASLKMHYGFEADCVRARHNCNMRHLERIQPRAILEIGCGAELLFDVAVERGLAFDNWTVIEPATLFADLCRERAKTDPRLHIFEGMCEQVAAVPPVSLAQPFDVLILSGVLQDASDPAELLRSSLGLIRKGGWVLVTCPNALSFHRLLAVSMGLAPSAHTLGPRNLQFQQRVVFDHQSLRELLTTAGIAELVLEGYMFKPFTHEQMAQVLPLLPASASQGLEELGRQFPVNAAEIAFSGRWL